MLRSLLIATLTVAGCSHATAEPELLVFAASSTSDALDEIAHDYTTRTGRHVTCSYGASSTLARQIAAGAPADVFLSADVTRMDELEHAGLVRAGDRRDLLGNQLVVVVPRASTAAVTRPQDLASLARVALGDPTHVPVGVYARKWLEGARVWDAIAPHVVPLLDARATLAAVATGQADAAVVYRTDAAVEPRVRIAYQVPTQAAPAIVYPVARVATSRHPDAARALVDFLDGDEARAVFTRRGFTLPARDR